MATYDEGITAEELKDFLTKQVSNLLLLKKLLILLVVIACVALIGHVIYYYNHLTSLRYDVEASESMVFSALQYRANLVPVLIESVVSFVEHEDNVFNRAVDARERSIRSKFKIPESLTQPPNATGFQMDDMLQKMIIAIAEQYPALTSSQPFQQLMKEVAAAELQIYNQRLNYNDKLNIYTTSISMFPGNAYATFLFNFPTYDYFKGQKYSEWPHFEGKPHLQWPQVELELKQAKQKTQENAKEK
nr:magnetosome protein MamQ-greigite [Desulfobacteraceae bacterium]